MFHQPTKNLSRETSLSRRHTHTHREAPLQSRLNSDESEIADAEALELDDPVLGGFVNEVCTRSGSPAYVAKIVAGIPWMCRGSNLLMPLVPLEGYSESISILKEEPLNTSSHSYF